MCGILGAKMVAAAGFLVGVLPGPQVWRFGPIPLSLHFFRKLVAPRAVAVVVGAGFRSAAVVSAEMKTSLFVGGSSAASEVMKFFICNSFQARNRAERYFSSLLIAH